MSKHTTYPENFTGKNSHTACFYGQAIGNWNKHKKRRVRSAERTKGRRNRYELRHTIDGHYEG